ESVDADDGESAVGTFRHPTSSPDPVAVGPGRGNLAVEAKIPDGGTIGFERESAIGRQIDGRGCGRIERGQFSTVERRAICLAGPNRRWPASEPQKVVQQNVGRHFIEEL